MFIEDEGSIFQRDPEFSPRERRRPLFIEKEGKLTVNTRLDFLPAASMIMGATEQSLLEQGSQLTADYAAETLNRIHRDFDNEGKEVGVLWARVVGGHFGVYYNEESHRFEVLPAPLNS